MSRTLVEKRDVKPEELVEAGLASPARSSSRGVGVIDKFRGRVLFPIRDQNGAATGMGGRILGAEGEGGRDTGPKYLNTPGTPLFDKSRSLYLIDKAKGVDAQVRPGRDRRGLHGRADGPPGRLRQRRRLARDGAHAGPGRAADPVREAHRARVRRRPGRPEGRHVRRAGAPVADRPARRDRERHRARRGPRRAAARGQGPRRGPARDAGSLARGGPHRAADRRVPRRHLRQDLRPQDAGRQGPLRRRAHADHPGRAEPGHARRLPPARPSRVGRRGARAARGPPRRARSGERRVSPPARSGAGRARGRRGGGRRVADLGARRSSPRRTRCR